MKSLMWHNNAYLSLLQCGSFIKRPLAWFWSRRIAWGAQGQGYQGCQVCSVMLPGMPDPGWLAGFWPGVVLLPGFLVFPGILVLPGFLAIPGIPAAGLGKLWSPEPGPGHWRQFIIVSGGIVPGPGIIVPEIEVPNSKVLGSKVPKNEVADSKTSGSKEPGGIVTDSRAPGSKVQCSTMQYNAV